jgi:hypothetical protein
MFLALGERGGDTFFSNLKLTVPFLLAGASGSASFLTGLIGIIMARERSVFVFLSTAIGLLAMLYLIGSLAG